MMRKELLPVALAALALAAACDEPGVAVASKVPAPSLVSSPPPAYVSPRDAECESALRDAVGPAGTSKDAGRPVFDGAAAAPGEVGAVSASRLSACRKAAFTGGGRRDSLKVVEPPAPGAGNGGGEADGGAEAGALYSDADRGSVPEAADPEALLPGMDAASIPAAVPYGATDKAKLWSVCAPKGSGLTREKLVAVLPSWTEIGTRGGASYILGGYMAGRSCQSTTKPERARKDLENQGFTGIADADIPKSFSEKILGPLNAAGRMCGDCVSWPSALYRCAGYSGTPLGDIKERGPKAKEFLSRAATCREAAEKSGGLRFGDVFHFTGEKGRHMFLYLGGAGLPYEVLEMGGSTSAGCKAIPGLPKKLGCVHTHADREKYRLWKAAGQSCDHFRVF